MTLRKQKQEEEPVDIFTVPGSPARFRPQPLPHAWLPTENGTGADEDEDHAWADDEPDDDNAGWSLKVLLEDEADEADR